MARQRTGSLLDIICTEIESLLLCILHPHEGMVIVIRNQEKGEEKDNYGEAGAEEKSHPQG